MLGLEALIKSKKRELEEKGLMSRKFFKRSELNETESQDGSPEKIKTEAHGTEKVDVYQNKEAEDNDGGPQLQRTEVIRRLRDRGEPILLFAETSLESFRRLRQLEIVEPEINRGLRNDFQEALESVDQAYVDEIVKTTDGAAPGTVADLEETTTLEEICDLAKSIPAQGSAEISSKVILKFLQLITQMWQQELAERAERERVSVRGKMDSATYTQTQRYLKPLTKKLAKQSLPEDILESLIEIVSYCLDRDYVQATSSYLQMAIGNAPWPIGVTMVGIHARTGREKISSRHVAHVLNDETQRKYIQGLKRIITKCQSFFPTDPSKCVEYNASKS